MPPKTGRVKPVRNANASASGVGGKAAGRDGKSAKSTASSKPGLANKNAPAPKSNMVREVKPMTPVAPVLEEEAEAEPPSDVKHDNPMYNEFGLDGRKIASPEPTTKWGRFWKRVRTAYHASAFYKKKRQLKKRWRDYREKKRQMTLLNRTRHILPFDFPLR